MSLCLLSANRNDNWCLMHLEVQQKSTMKLLSYCLSKLLSSLVCLSTSRSDRINASLSLPFMVKVIMV